MQLTKRDAEGDKRLLEELEAARRKALEDELDRTKQEYERLRKFMARIVSAPAFLALSD